MESQAAPQIQPPADYPVRLTAVRQEHYHRLLPLVKWLLAFPHYIVLIFIGIGALIAHLVAFFAVLITGRYPRGLWDFNVGAFRWGYRVFAYVYLLEDKYPPFSLQSEPDYPADLQADYPEHVNRWRPLVHWLLIIPYYFVASILIYVAFIIAFIAVFVILFTARLPEGMFKLILNPIQWSLRSQFYAYYMVTRYPPFEWD